MVRPLVDVLGASAEDSEALCKEWATLVSDLEFVAATDSRALTQTLEKRRPAAVVIRVVDSRFEAVATEVAQRFSAVPLLVLGSAQIASARKRSAPTLSAEVEDHSAIVQFFRDDVLGAARGVLHGVALPSVLQVLCIERRTCSLRVRAGRRIGVLIVRSGLVVHAQFPGDAPLAAALRILSWGISDVLIEPAPATLQPTLDLPLDFLLLESARQADERREPGANRRPESLLPPAANERAQSASAEWSFATLPEEALRLVDSVIAINGALVAELVDVERRALIIQRICEGERAVSPSLVAAVGESALDMLLDMEKKDWVEEVTIRFSSCFKLIRPLQSIRTVVLCAAFDSKQITIGLASTRLAQLVSANS